MSDNRASGGPAEGHSGFVAIIGRPNVGKSTLLNAFVGAKLAIISSKPQTTRNRITGVVNRGACQIVFIDTPGIHESPKLMNVRMNQNATAALEEVDAAIFIVDASVGVTEADRRIAGLLGRMKTPVLMVANKCDLGVRDREGLKEAGGSWETFEVSASSGEGLDALLDRLVALMPPGPKYYPEDELTDRPERFVAAEFVREKVFAFTGDEIPYSSAVTVDLWEDKPEQNLAVIHATIHVERQSQKAIIIGKGGTMIKRIGRAAREDLERLLGARVYLDLHVGVEPNWTKDERQLKRFGLDG